MNTYLNQILYAKETYQNMLNDNTILWVTRQWLKLQIAKLNKELEQWDGSL